MKESWVSSNYIHKGNLFSLRVGEVFLENGLTANREIIEHCGGAAVIPLLDNNLVIMVRQFRISIGREILELPGGRLKPDELPEYRAHCELEEETGYRASQLVHVARFYSSPGFTNQQIYIYLALGLEKTEQNLDWDENIQLELLPLERVRKMLLNDEFEDANAIIGLHGLFAYLENQ